MIRRVAGNTVLKLVVLAVLIVALIHIGREVATWYFLDRGGRILKASLPRDKDHRPALYWLKLAEAADPRNPMVHLYMGLYHTKSGDPRAAEASFKRFGELAEKDLGYFFRVLYAMKEPAEASAPATSAASAATVGMTIVTTSPPAPAPLAALPPIDLAAHDVSPPVALLFAWIGIHRMEKPLVEAAFDRAAPLEGHSFQYHIARAVWDLRAGERKSGIDQLERALALRETDRSEGASGVGLVPFAFRLSEEASETAPAVGRWVGRVVTHPESNNAFTAQLLAAVAVVGRQRGEYKRSIAWAELARKRYEKELTRLGLMDHVERLVWPLNYESLVARAARKYRLDPLIVMSVIRAESHFDAQATSPVGARGLMQLMPRTAGWIATMLKWGSFSDELLSNPSDNIEFGTYYLAYLRGALGEGEEALPWVLAAYNGGIGNVKRWQGLKSTTAGPDLEAIEFKETRDYIVRVTGAHKHYVRLYGARYADAQPEEPQPEDKPEPNAPRGPKKPARRPAPGPRGGKR